MKYSKFHEYLLKGGSLLILRIEDINFGNGRIHWLGPGYASG
jgi:hypothetical protein